MGKDCQLGHLLFWMTQTNSQGVENRNFVSPSRCPRCRRFRKKQDSTARFQAGNVGNWFEDIEDMWDLYSYVDCQYCQCHYILLQCICFLLNKYMYQSYYLNTFLNYDITIVIDPPPPPHQQQHHLFFLGFHQFKAQEGSPTSSKSA